MFGSKLSYFAICFFGFLGLLKVMTLPFAPDPREVSFFCPLPRSEKIKEKKIPRVGGEYVAMKWDVAALKTIMNYEL